METKAVIVIFSVLLCCSLEAYGQLPAASFTVAGPIMTKESDGLLEVCVNVTNGNNITDAGVAIQVFLSDETTEREDYRLEQNIIRFTRDMTTGCVSIILIQDDLVEDTEAVLVRISSTTITTNTPDILTVIIEDSDNLRVGFTQPMYTALESSSTSELCTRLEAGQVAIDRNLITVRFTVTPETANINEDFMMPLMMNEFNSSTAVGSVQCVPIIIVNDKVIERNETFRVQLREVDSVIFSERDTTVVIQDNDFASVTLDRNQTMLTEGNDTMNQTLMFNIVLMDDKDGLDRDVIINISATEISATGQSDFVLLNTSVTFPPNSRPSDQQPFYVLILGDNFIETDEVFAVNLSAIFPDIIGDPGSAVVTISRDGDSICSILLNPLNGMVEMSNNTLGSIAMYSCITSHMLIGPEERNCTADIGWSGEDPQCLRICGDLSIEDGSVDTGLSVEGVVANYNCNTGFRLVGDAGRVCQSNGLWSGMNPACQAIPDGLTTRPAVVGSDNSRSIGIGVGVGIGGFLVILLVVILVVVTLLLIRRSRSSKRYIVNRGDSSKRKPSVSESNVSIGESLQEISPTEYLTDEGLHSGTTDVNSEVNGKLDQNGGMEPSDTQNKIDLSKDEESTDLNNEITDTPTNITDNETTFTEESDH